MNHNILLAGFGGQGILFAGKFLAYSGMLHDKFVSWLPSYGPAMRGGTANCSVIIGNTPIGSPIVNKPDILIAMNLPSLDKYEPECAPNALVILDSSLIGRSLVRTDLSGCYIPATALADENGLKGMANMIMLGKLTAASSVCAADDIEAVLKKTVPERKKELFEANFKALRLGYEYRS
ncbi:MAG: 2-oxoacid:acceptor oxidoreductase family protein [Dehalococcoidia bacterium]|nr:2-oxoacid:acceptor oxidoreductase family protein [Dehalococcoidia bacterium]